MKRLEEGLHLFNQHTQAATVAQERKHAEQRAGSKMESKVPMSFARQGLQVMAINCSRIWQERGGRDLSAAPLNLATQFKNAIGMRLKTPRRGSLGDPYFSWLRGSGVLTHQDLCIVRKLDLVLGMGTVQLAVLQTCLPV